MKEQTEGFSDPAPFYRLVQAVTAYPADVIVVSDEVGLGVVPASPEGRAFRDLLGWLNQLLAAAADNVDLVVAGLPLPLKGGRVPLWR